MSFNAPDPAPRSNKTLWIVLGIIGVVGVCGCIPILAAILFPVFSQAKLAAITSQNMKQAKQIGTAMHIYLAESDDVFPPADRWTDAISPLISDPTTFDSPATEGGEYGYAFNEALGGINLLSIPNLEATPMIFNTTISGPNAFGSVDDFALKVGKGKPVICFADASAASIKEEDELRSLDWTPKLETPLVE